MEHQCFDLVSFLDNSNIEENNQQERRKALGEFNKANQKQATAAKTRSDVEKPQNASAKRMRFEISRIMRQMN